MSDFLTVPAGYRLQSFDSIDSTNAEALRQIADGEPSGKIIWARHQSEGRGRRGRSWHSPPGNLYITITVLRPPDRLVGQLAFVAAIGAGEAVKGALVSQELLQYKWPNDLMLEGQKLGGILIETGSYRDTEQVAIGLGINVACKPSGMNATSLDDYAMVTPVEEILRAVCRSFEHWYQIWQQDGFSPIRERWLEAAHRLDEPIEIRFPDGTSIDGTFRGLDQDGALTLEQNDGKTVLIAAGEVFVATA